MVTAQSRLRLLQCSKSARATRARIRSGTSPLIEARISRRCVGAQKIVRLHRFFLHQISLESKLNGRQKVKGGNGSISASISTSLIASLICLAHCLAHHPEPRSGLCPELLADFRNVPEKGCSFVISTPHFETRSPRLPSGKVNS